jgi:peptidyl-prolyl cis-trans isomerase B (cyclophilin B)
MTMAKGDQVLIDLQGNEAPATVARVLARIDDPNDGYRGVTFHRLLPNLLIQGGSRDGSDWTATPCETAGPRGAARGLRLCQFWKDELNPLRHERGAVALATNEPNTGIGQFFFDLVDTPAFNHRYTVFGKIACVKPARPLMQRTGSSFLIGLYDPMDLIDHFVEGEEIQKIEVPSPKLNRKTLVCRP